MALVLILVLMEDALALEEKQKKSLRKVLILVLMEDALAHGMSVQFTLKEGGVLILVLMEDALAQSRLQQQRQMRLSLNPCSNGRCTRTRKFATSLKDLVTSLNPCSNGRCTRTYRKGNDCLKQMCLNPCSNGRCTRTCLNLN